MTAAPPRVLTVELALLFGVSRSRVLTEVGRGNWQRLAVGFVLTRPDEPIREDWADVGIALGGPGAALTGWDAVQLSGLGARVPPPAEVTVVSPAARSRLVGGVRIRRTDRPYSSQRQPLGAPFELVPVVSTARAVADTALLCRDGTAVRGLVTSAVQRRRCTAVELASEYDAAPRNRSRSLRVALADVVDGARSAAEARAAQRLARGSVPPFELNVPVVDQHGTLLFVVDELWRELRSGVEIDSREYHLGVEEWEATLARHNDLGRFGLALLHYSPAVILGRHSTFADEVRQWLDVRAAELQAPLPRGRGIRRPGPDGPLPFVVRVPNRA